MCIRDRSNVLRTHFAHAERCDIPRGMPITYSQAGVDIDRGDALVERIKNCLLYTSDAADERSSVDLGGRRIIKKKNTN